jgi:hypothetical protein
MLAVLGDPLEIRPLHGWLEIFEYTKPRFFEGTLRMIQWHHIRGVTIPRKADTRSRPFPIPRFKSILEIIGYDCVGGESEECCSQLLDCFDGSDVLGLDWGDSELTVNCSGEPSNIFSKYRVDAGIPESVSRVKCSHDRSISVPFNCQPNSTMLCDTATSTHCLECMVSQEENVSWIHFPDLSLQINTTGLDFCRLRCAIVRWPAVDSISNINLGWRNTGSFECPIKKLTGCSREDLLRTLVW